MSVHHALGGFSTVLHAMVRSKRGRLTPSAAGCACAALGIKIPRRLVDEQAAKGRNPHTTIHRILVTRHSTSSPAQ